MGASSLSALAQALHELPATAETVPTDTELEFPDDPAIWSRSLEVGLWTGYHDNLLQNAAANEDSFLLGANLSAGWLRVPLDGRQVSLVFSGEYVRYPDGRQVDYEAFFAAITEFKVELSRGWQAGVGFNYVFLDQIIDTSITETNLSAALIRAHGLTLRPELAKELSRTSRLRFSLGASRHWFHQPFDDFSEVGPKFAWEQDYGTRSGFILSYQYSQWLYDTREEVSEDGVAVPGTDLRFQVHDTELEWRHSWGTNGPWRTSAKLGWRANRDSSSSGYFDYHRYQFRPEVRYDGRRWDLKGQLLLAHYDFPHQQADVTSGPRRARTRFGATFRAEYSLNRYLRLFGEYSFEDTASNREVDEYQFNKLIAGVLAGF